jgi:hypothetical protein
MPPSPSTEMHPVTAWRLTDERGRCYNACHDGSAIPEYLYLLDETFQDLLSDVSR